MLVALFSLILISSFAENRIQTVRTYDPPGGWSPGEPYFTLHAVVTENPDWGRFGGYHPIWQAIKNDLAAIGIDVQITQYNEFNWWKRVWDIGWDDPWTDGGGWDMTMLEWWLQPHALDPWFTSLVRSDLKPDEGGHNIFPWNNSDADDLLDLGTRAFNALTRQTYLHLWQQVFMDDPPWINLYYPKVYDIMGRYITGYDPSATWFYDTAHLNLNNTMLQEARPDRDPNTAIYAISDPYWAMNPMFMTTRTEEQASTLCFRTLYKWSVAPFPTDGSIPSWENYTIVPDMAAGYPTYLNNNQTVRVTLRDGMVWRYNNGTTVPITADDVVWTFETVLDPATTATGIGDFIWIIENVTKVDNLTVDFNLLNPCPDILSVLSNDWGTGCILPKHRLEGIPIAGLRVDGSNKNFSDPTKWMPVSGPFMWDPSNPPIIDDDITLIKNPSYYGYGLGWGPYNVDKFILQWIKNPPTRLVALINNDVDLGEYPTAPVATFIALNNTVNYPYLRVVQYNRPASNPIWLNFNNEYLSNRYVRMAIANAIDYNYIINTLLPPWGIANATRGKTPILPQHYYTDENDTTVQLFNTCLSPYTQNVTRALAYMDRWKKSQVGYTSPYPGGIYLEGAAGDADFNGKVELDDFYIWRNEGWPLGTMPIPFLPGQDKDPDWNNDGSIEINPDYFIYRDETAGTTYFPAHACIGPAGVSAADYPSVYVDPASTINPALIPPNTYTIEIWTDYSDGENITGYQFSLTYNSSVLAGVSVAMEDGILGDDGTFINGTFDNTNGELSLTLAYCVPDFVTSGPGKLATVTFNVVGIGDSDIILGYNTLLKGWDPVLEMTYNIVNAMTMPFNIGHGYFDNRPHDVAVINVTPSKTIVGQNYPMSINVTVENQGEHTETFDVTAYANATIIDTLTNIILSSGNPTTLTFTWDTTGFTYGNYTISAVADTVPGETDTTDNTYVDGLVLVTIPGDVNGDRIVDIFDIGTISSHWYPGPPVGPLGYHGNADINNDEAVDIFDIDITSANWGKMWALETLGSEWLNCHAYDSTYTAWTTVGGSPYLDAQDQPTNYVHESSAQAVNIGWFDFPSTTLTGTLNVNISVYCNNDDGVGDDYANVYVDYTGSGAGTDVGDVAQHTGWQYDTIDLGVHTVSEVNNLRVYLEYQKVGGADDIRIDHIRIVVLDPG